MIIDIEAMKRGEVRKSKKKKFQSIEVVSEVFDPHLCCKSSNNSSKFNIDHLLNKSILKEIELKREQ